MTPNLRGRLKRRKIASEASDRKIWAQKSRRRPPRTERSPSTCSKMT